jgi:hypothetical protein
LNREVFVDFDEVWPVPSLNIGNWEQIDRYQLKN